MRWDEIGGTDGWSAAPLSCCRPGAGVLREQQQSSVHGGAGPVGEVHWQTRDIWPEQTSCCAAAGHGCTVRRPRAPALYYSSSVSLKQTKVAYPLDYVLGFDLCCKSDSAPPTLTVKSNMTCCVRSEERCFFIFLKLLIQCDNTHPQFTPEVYFLVQAPFGLSWFHSVMHCTAVL